MRLFILTCLTGFLAGNVCSADTVRWHQDRFCISYWVDPPIDGNEDQYYKDLKEAGFTVALGAFGARTPETVKRQLELCEKYDLKALVWSRDAMEGAYPESPACWGYMIVDEPNVTQYPELRSRVDEIRAKRPGKLGFINLFPDYATYEQLGFAKDESGVTNANAYNEYVKRFTEQIDPDLICMDHYPVMRPDNDGRFYYCRNLSVMRKYSLQKGIPFWNFFNTQVHGTHTDPTEAQLRWQVYTSLAYGAKGVLYFCYWTPSGFGKCYSLITPDGRKTRHYYQAQRINAAIGKLGPVLMELTSTSVGHITKKSNPPEDLKGTGIANLQKAEPSDPDLDYLVGAFVHRNGRRAVMVVNYDISFTSLATFTFDIPAEKIMEVRQDTGAIEPVLDDSSGIEGLQLSFDSGEGRLFILSAPKTNE
ncbi:MAG TPA: beta-galactosidase [Candidatus Hydrogenedentes bacterium]|nr:beta-galactosidase [Candidatus Hydrogenedentota bacterium]